MTKQELILWICELAKAPAYPEIMAAIEQRIDSVIAEHDQGKQDIICPFCGDDDFDKIGLKNHLIKHCEIYPEIETLK